MSRPSDAYTKAAHQIVLPDAPQGITGPVKAWRQPVLIRTYIPEAPRRNPMFLEKRVYQGSSGKVYPLPFFDRIASEPEDKLWDAIHIENEFVRLMILPELGGRIHVGYDKISGYDFFYRQNVIKPALVGLAGPWISGGVEFNWPQHHRPATFMPVETCIENGPDGEITIWCSDHDPMLRMKGMHGVCLQPGRSVVNLKVRLYNRTQFTQTFLWWANVATRVHERYQSFFPTDVRFVADHAKRAITSFPLSDRPYYGIDYPTRAAEGVPEEERPNHFQPDGSYAANDLSWYANIPVPTSYMVTGTSMDFFGGYDHIAKAGVVHVADHHISPGKKQWTWGNHEFGYAWDRNLTETDGPYIELMAGVYTDNQPDFSYLAPWETKTFTQTWYPIRNTGIPQMANTDAAVHLDVSDGAANIAVCVTRTMPNAQVQLLEAGEELQTWSVSLDVCNTFLQKVKLPPKCTLHDLAVTITEAGKTVLAFDPATITPAEEPEIAQEPPAPDQVETIEELYLTGVHLEQYRHATRRPEPYWLEALRRDPQESRCLNALGRWHLRRGEVNDAIDCFSKAIKRLTRLNPNPYDGEPLYNLGVALRLARHDQRAYDAFFKATWNAAWRAPAYFALAEIEVSRCDWKSAEDHLERSLRTETDNLNARNLLAYVLKQTGRSQRAERLTEETLALDPLDVGALWARGQAPHDGQIALDLAFDLLRAGRCDEATQLLTSTNVQTAGSAGSIILLALADIQSENSPSLESITLRQLETLSHDYCFPSRVEEMLLLQRTVKRHPSHALSWYLLGNFYYDRTRHEEAIEAWEASASLRPENPTVWRNLGIAYFNVRKDTNQAREAYDKAFLADPSDGRVLYERDQLWKRIGVLPEDRIKELCTHRILVEARDDLSVELATAYNQLNQPEEALHVILNRCFQPWEGGEGLVLAQFVRARLQLGYHLLTNGRASEALEQFLSALRPPRSLGEAKHLLVNQSDIFFWSGLASAAMNNEEQARTFYWKAARQKGDFQQMSVRDISEMTFWSGLAFQNLGRKQQAEVLFRDLNAYAEALEKTTPKIDYFATSLPAMLLFDDDLEKRNQVQATFLKAQAALGLGDFVRSQHLLEEVIKLDANHAAAHDLLIFQEAFTEKTGRV